MVAIARSLSCASGINVEVDTLKALLLFCEVGLTVSSDLASYGLDLSTGFFKPTGRGPFRFKNAPRGFKIDYRLGTRVSEMHSSG
jgi:hypothetical protein